MHWNVSVVCLSTFFDAKRSPLKIFGIQENSSYRRHLVCEFDRGIELSLTVVWIFLWRNDWWLKSLSFGR